MLSSASAWETQLDLFSKIQTGSWQTQVKEGRLAETTEENVVWKYYNDTYLYANGKFLKN